MLEKKLLFNGHNKNDQNFKTATNYPSLQLEPQLVEVALQVHVREDRPLQSGDINADFWLLLGHAVLSVEVITCNVPLVLLSKFKITKRAQYIRSKLYGTLTP